MNQKQLDEVLAGIVSEVAKANGLEEAEARTLVGIALKKNKAAFIQAVVVPTLGIVATSTPAA